MESSTGTNSGNIMWFFREKGFDDKRINAMLKKCNKLDRIPSDQASENWEYLKKVGIKERKLPSIVSKCPKILTLSLPEKLIPMVECLSTLTPNPKDVASAISKFPQILSHSVEEKLSPLLAFFETLNVPEKQLGKTILLNPRIVSYSIDSKLKTLVEFLVENGLSRETLIGKILMKHPNLMGYSVEKRLRPTMEFLKASGLSRVHLQRAIVNAPEVLCRDVERVLRPNMGYLRGWGFDDVAVAEIVSGCPSVLYRSVGNSLRPRMEFLVKVMGRQVSEVVGCPLFFQCGFKKKLQNRFRVLKEKGMECSLSEMLECNERKFRLKFGLSSV